MIAKIKDIINLNITKSNRYIRLGNIVPNIGSPADHILIDMCIALHQNAKYDRIITKDVLQRILKNNKIEIDKISSQMMKYEICVINNNLKIKIFKSVDCNSSFISFCFSDTFIRFLTLGVI